MNLDREQVELMAKLAPAVLPLVKTGVDQRLQERQMERRKETELELIEARQSAETTTAPTPTTTPTADAADTTQRVQQQSDDEFAASIDDLIADEDCDLCCKLLEGIKEIEPSKRPQALAEYGRFKQSSAETNDVDEIRSEIEKMDVLREVMMQEFNMAPS